MKLKSALYKLLALSNDVYAINQAAKHRDATPIVRRIGRRAWVKLTGRLAGKLFG